MWSQTIRGNIMPLKKCSENGKSGGWKWGNQGKCYFGPDAKKKAIKQGYAEDPKHFNQIMKNESSIHTDLIKEIISDNDTTIEEAEAFFDLLGKNPLDKIVALEYISAKKKILS